METGEGRIASQITKAMCFEIIFSNSARKELAKIEPANRQRIANSINDFSENPRPNGYIKLKGIREDLYRIRVGNFRILYTIDDEVRIVDIRKIADRKDVYDSL